MTVIFIYLIIQFDSNAGSVAYAIMLTICLLHVHVAIRACSHLRGVGVG